MPNPLIEKSEFEGIEQVVHLSAGGESPMLRSHQNVIQQFISDKAQGERARSLQDDVLQATRKQCADLFSVTKDTISLLSSASEGINIVAYGIDWKTGDNVVIADVEFGSGVFPWLLLQERGVEIRVVRHKQWQIDINDIANQIDDRTRVVLMSHVSMFTGQRVSLPLLSTLVRSSNAKLILDATHAAGVVDVDAALADVVVSSCYKWLLGVHGAAIFYWNRARFPELKTPFLGWNSVSKAGGWQQPMNMTLRDDASRFMPGNPSFISVYILQNALATIASTGIEQIENHALDLTGKLWHGINSMKRWEIMTPEQHNARAGNVCIMTDRVDEVARALRARNVLVWGTYAGDERLRISCHVYNSNEDINTCLEALNDV